MSATLFVVSTPIGNLEDITYRAARILCTAAYIACEDTRKTGLLLSEIAKRTGYIREEKPRLIQYHDRNERKQTEWLISLLEEGQDVVLVSDAGTPGISDPGYRIVAACRKKGIRVAVVPGVSAPTAALSVSGLPTERYTFHGYMPEKEGRALSLLTLIQNETIPATHIFFLSVHKMIRNLQWIENILGDQPIVLLRELTKMHESYQYGSARTLREYCEAHPPKGECVVLWRLRKSDEFADQ
jgi:16S rRNA (cytidine1402-2'-O)-methyltransferase